MGKRSLHSPGLAWPLDGSPEVLTGDHPGSFGAVRKYDTHTGIDLYAENGAPVYACEEGVVIEIEDFTGESAGSPWWEETKAVLVYNYDNDRTIVYGEVDPLVKVHHFVRPGDLIGTVKRVLKTDKGKPLSMLHFEMYAGVLKETVWWKHDEKKPQYLQDPTSFLQELRCLNIPSTKS